MSFHPVMSEYRYLVIATDPDRPSWTGYVWGGFQTLAEAKEYQRSDKGFGTGHLVFVIKKERASKRKEIAQ